MHHFDISCPCVCHSVGHDDITGDAPNHLATVVLDHAAMTEFCGIPLISLRENCITELNLERKGVGVPGAIVLSKLLPSATAITSLKYACHANVFAFLSERPLTRRSHLSHPAHRLQYRGQCHRSRGHLRARCHPQGDYDLQPQVRRRPMGSLLCQRPLTLLISHHLRAAPRSQSDEQQHRRQGHLRTRRHPQGDADL